MVYGSGISPILVLAVINVATEGGLGHTPVDGRALILGRECSGIFGGRGGAKSICDSKRSAGIMSILGSRCTRRCSGEWCLRLGWLSQGSSAMDGGCVVGNIGVDCVLPCRGRGEPFGLRLEPGGDAVPDLIFICSTNFVELAFREDNAEVTDEPLFVRGGHGRTQPPLTSRLFSARVLTLGST
jgi:hypothetical protein